MPVETVSLAEIKLDPELQPREDIDRALVREYTELILNGTEFPPVVLFDTGRGKPLLADGWHRFYAYEGAGRKALPAEVRKGDRRAALLHSLRANSTHGKQRSQLTLVRAYDIAVSRGLVRAHDTRGVMQILNCRPTIAKELTAEARNIREATLRSVALMMQSRSVRQKDIAERLGVSQQWVSKITTKAASGDRGTEADGPTKEALEAIAAEIREQARAEVAEDVRKELVEEHKRRLDELRAEIEAKMKTELDEAKAKAEAAALEGVIAETQPEPDDGLPPDLASMRENPRTGPGAGITRFPSLGSSC